MSETGRPHPKNVPGPFYVVDGCCTACGVPFTEAPGLFAYDDKDHCFVKQQPSSKAEFNRMMHAVWAAEFQCIRYRGQDPDILRRFGELGEPHLCDVSPPTSIRPLFRNHVTFDATTPQAESLMPQDLAMAFQEHLQSLNRHRIAYEFTPLVGGNETAAFSYSWYQSNFHPIEFLTVSMPNCRWLVWHSPDEKVGSRGVSNDVDGWLKKDARFNNVRWYTEGQWQGSKEWQEMPW
jgi:hypothetical protein